VIASTIRPKPGDEVNLDGFATAIVRVLPIDSQGNTSGTRWQLLKLYAMKGSAFYDKLLSLRGAAASSAELDIIGCFTVDPFSILKVIEKKDLQDGTWAVVPFPVAFAVFGETQ
jgi:hypothetical protein